MNTGSKKEDIGMNMKQRIVSIAAALMLIISLVSSVTFSAVEANHDCIGESCPICIQIKGCENTLKNLVFTVSGCKAALAVVFFVCLIVKKAYTVFCADTLISLKVKLSD